MAVHRGSSKKRGTPPELDYLFERQIIDPENYVDFWVAYKRKGITKSEQQEIVDGYVALAEEAEGDEELQAPLAHVVTRNRADAEKQAMRTGGRVQRRNAKGQFSSRGTYYTITKRSVSKSKLGIQHGT
jgi:hypothetical protein